MLSYGSLFTGIGGFDLGLDRAGFECAWQVEIDSNCNQILQRHWPDVERFQDIKSIRPGQLGKVDLISAGFPCQDFSKAGTRKGLEGNRSGLFWEVVRVAKVARPKWLLLENVPGILSQNGGRDFATVIESVGQLGYGLAWRVLDSQYFGLAQRRKRVFIIGYLGAPCPREILFDEKSGSWHPEKGRGKGEIAATITSGGASKHSREPGFIVWDAMQITSKANRSRIDPGSPAPTLNQKGQVFVSDELAQSSAWKMRGGISGGGKGYLESTDKSFTLMTNQDQYIGTRRLTPVECERLQGFPDGWTFGSDTGRYRAIGNAVSVPVAEWIGKRIARVVA